jgi:hypothetical protein
MIPIAVYMRHRDNPIARASHQLGDIFLIAPEVFLAIAPTIASLWRP